jgi:hypothetical protein
MRERGKPDDGVFVIHVCILQGLLKYAICSSAYELCDCGRMQCWIVEFRDWALAEAQFPKRALPIPATFVVGRDGLIIDRFVDPDFPRQDGD